MSLFNDFDFIVKTMGDLPPSPMVSTKILELMRQSDVKLRQLANAVSLDPAISARLMKMANSVFYDQQGKVSTVERAIVVVGQNTLKNLAMDCSLRNVNKTYGLLERRLWENAIGCAVGARLIALTCGGCDPEEAYLMGLLHHIGKIVMINRDKDLYREVVQVVEAGGGNLRDVERGLFAFSHEMVGAALLDHWNFPEQMVAVARHHHQFEHLEENHPEVYRTCAIVHLAARLCRVFAIGYSRLEEELDLSSTRGAVALHLASPQLEKLCDDFQPAFVKERTLFLS